VDGRDLGLTEAEMRKQLGYLNDTVERVLYRAAQMASDQPITVEATSFQINNYYSAVEDLCRIVATAFENNIADASRWHSELIDRMTLDVAGVRPALLSDETAQLLHRLRSFRHFFRHAYRVELDEGEVRQNLERLREVHPRLLTDVERFLAQLRAA
jgi:hypothetical protein